MKFFQESRAVLVAMESLNSFFHHSSYHLLFIGTLMLPLVLLLASKCMCMIDCDAMSTIQIWCKVRGQQSLSYSAVGPTSLFQLPESASTREHSFTLSTGRRASLLWTGLWQWRSEWSSPRDFLMFANMRLVQVYVDAYHVVAHRTIVGLSHMSSLAPCFPLTPFEVEFSAHSFVKFSLVFESLLQEIVPISSCMLVIVSAFSVVLTPL